MEYDRLTTEYTILSFYHRCPFILKPFSGISTSMEERKMLKIKELLILLPTTRMKAWVTGRCSSCLLLSIAKLVDCLQKCS